MQTLDNNLQHILTNAVPAITEKAQQTSRASDTLDLACAVRAAFDELDLRQLAVFARLSPARRLQMMFDLCEFSRQMIVASERQNNPRLMDKGLARRVRERIELAYGA